MRRVLKQTNKQVNKPKPISECFVSWKHLSDFPNTSHWELRNSGGQNTLESPIALSKQGRLLEIIALTTAKRFPQSFKLAQNSFDGQLQPASLKNQDSQWPYIVFLKGFSSRNSLDDWGVQLLWAQALPYQYAHGLNPGLFCILLEYDWGYKE